MFFRSVNSLSDKNAWSFLQLTESTCLYSTGYLISQEQYLQLPAGMLPINLKYSIHSCSIVPLKRERLFAAGGWRENLLHFTTVFNSTSICLCYVFTAYVELMGRRREYVDLRGREDTGENYIMRNYIIFTPRQILWWSNQGGVIGGTCSAYGSYRKYFKGLGINWRIILKWI